MRSARRGKTHPLRKLELERLEPRALLTGLAPDSWGTMGLGAVPFGSDAISTSDAILSCSSLTPDSAGGSTTCAGVSQTRGALARSNNIVFGAGASPPPSACCLLANDPTVSSQYSAAACGNSFGSSTDSTKPSLGAGTSGSLGGTTESDPTLTSQSTDGLVSAQQALEPTSVSSGMVILLHSPSWLVPPGQARSVAGGTLVFDDGEMQFPATPLSYIVGSIDGPFASPTDDSERQAGESSDPGPLAVAITLSDGPEGLGPEWTLDLTHKNPNGQRFRHPSGRYLDWHPGTEGKPGWRGMDHWHDTGGDKHLPPGTDIPAPETKLPPESNPKSVPTQIPGNEPGGTTAPTQPNPWIPFWAWPAVPKTTPPPMPIPGFAIPLFIIPIWKLENLIPDYDGPPLA